MNADFEKSVRSVGTSIIPSTLLEPPISNDKPK